MNWIGEAPQEIEQRGDWWWPSDDISARPAILQESVRHIPWALGYAKGGECIQAGGNVGVYPMALSRHFERIHTFEPDPLNYACLVRNLTNRTPNIVFRNAALGAEEGDCKVVHAHPGNCGAHVVQAGGDIPMTTIDGRGLKPTLIWLDVEGFELEALIGAQRTLAVSSPTIILEVKGLGPDPTEWLEARGYAEASRLNNDRLYQRV